MVACTIAETMAERRGSVHSGCDLSRALTVRSIGQDMPTIGRALARQLLSWRGNKQEIGTLAPIVLAVMLGEMQAATPAQRREELEYLVVAYLAFTRLCGRQGMLYMALLSPFLLTSAQA